jgi:hypothetical protein
VLLIDTTLLMQVRPEDQRPKQVIPLKNCSVKTFKVGVSLVMELSGPGWVRSCTVSGKGDAPTDSRAQVYFLHCPSTDDMKKWHAMVKAAIATAKNSTSASPP